MSGLRTQGVREGNMKVTFRSFADFREIIGAREQELSLPEGETAGRPDHVSIGTEASPV